MDQNNKTYSWVLTLFCIIIGLFGLLYAVLGTLSLAGTLTGVLPGHEAEEILIIVLSYSIAVIAIICCIACLAKKMNLCSIMGLIVGLIGLLSLIYMQIAQNTFSIFDCVAMVLGFEIFSLSAKSK